MNFAVRYLGTQYCPHNIRGLNCWGLVAAFYSEKGKAVPNYTIEKINARDIASAFTAAFIAGDHGFTKTDSPKDGDVILFKSFRRSHCGLLIAGKVLHSTPGRGVIYQAISDVKGFDIIEYWANDKN